MPSGSKKRKSKKPKSDEPPSSQGDPPELETGFEEGMTMAKDGEDGSTSPKATDGDTATLAEGGLEAKEISGEVLQGGCGEPEEFEKDFRTEDASADNCKGDLPSHTEPEPELPVATEGEAPAVKEPEGGVPVEIPQGEAHLQIEPEMDALPIETDASPVEIIPEMYTDAPPIEFNGDTDQVLNAPPDGIKPEADIGQDEIELSVELTPVERESEPYTAPIVGESRMDESIEATAPEDIKPETVEAAVETKAERDAAPADVEPAIDEAPVEMKSVTDTALPETDEIRPEADGAPADIQPDMEESWVEKEPETDEAPADAEPDVALAVAEREADIPQVEMDKLPVENQPEIDAAGPDIETQTDAAVQEIEKEIHTAVPEIKPEAPNDTEQDEMAQADIKPERELEPEVEALAEVQLEVDAENFDTSVDTEAQMERLQVINPDPESEPEPEPEPEEPSLETEPEIELKESPREIEPEPKSELEEPPQGIESEPEPEPEPEPEDLSEDESMEVDATMEPPQEIVLEPEATMEPPQEIELEPEATMELPQEIEPELDAEAVDEVKPEAEELAEIEPEAKRSPETELDEQGLVEGEVGASLQTNPEAEAEVPLEAEQEPEIEVLAESDQQDLVEIQPDQHHHQLHQQERGTELGELETSIPEDNQKQQEAVDAPELPVIKDELGDQVELPAISTSSSVDDSLSSTPVNEESGIELESFGKPEEGEDLPPSAVSLEGEGEGTVEGVSDDRGHGADLEQQNRETAVDNEQGVLDELPGKSAELIDEQEKVGDDGHDEDQAVSASAGDGSEAVLSCEQDLGIEQPPADIIDVEECATEVTLPKDQEQPPPDVIDVEECATEVSLPKDLELSMGLGAADEPPSAEFELVAQGLNTTLPSSESEITLDPYERKDEAVTSADDIGEDEAALSTVAEAGSVLNDFDENVHYEHELHTDFFYSEHIADTMAFEDTLSPKAPELTEIGLEDELDSETPPSEQQRSITASNGNELKLLVSEGKSPTDELDLKVGQGLVGNPPEKAEVLPESAEVAEAVEESHASHAEEGQDYVQPISSPCLLLEEGKADFKDGDGAASSILGGDSAKESPNIAENEVMSKSFSTEVDGQYNLSRSETPSNDLLDLRDESSIHGSEVNNMDETEIHAEEAKELKGAEPNSLGGDSRNVTNQAPVQSVPEENDIRVQAFRQESTHEASLPVVVPTQDRTMENVNVKSIGRPSGGVIVEGRKKWLGCCGMFDVLLGKN